MDEGEEGLLVDRASVPSSLPARTASEVVERIDARHRGRKWSVRLIWHHLTAGSCAAEKGQRPWHSPVAIALRTDGRWLHRLGISRLCDPTPNKVDSCRVPRRFTAYWPRHMVGHMTADTNRHMLSR